MRAFGRHRVPLCCEAQLQRVEAVHATAEDTDAPHLFVEAMLMFQPDTVQLI